jgi:hypothetical protein
MRRRLHTVIGIKNARNKINKWKYRNNKNWINQNCKNKDLVLRISSLHCPTDTKAKMKR